jgi:hypothetical protein
MIVYRALKIIRSDWSVSLGSRKDRFRNPLTSSAMYEPAIPAAEEFDFEVERRENGYSL